MDGLDRITTLAVPRPEQARAAVESASLLFRRHLANWSRDVLGLREGRRRLPGRTAEAADAVRRRHAA